jgi:hypothetical protein
MVSASAAPIVEPGDDAPNEYNDSQADCDPLAEVRRRLRMPLCRRVWTCGSGLLKR